MSRRLIAGTLRLSMKGLPRGPHITRYYMYRYLARFNQCPAPGEGAIDQSFGPFDYVVSDEVLEHIEGDPQQMMDESLRVLRRGSLDFKLQFFVEIGSYLVG